MSASAKGTQPPSSETPVLLNPERSPQQSAGFLQKQTFDTSSTLKFLGPSDFNPLCV